MLWKNKEFTEAYNDYYPLISSVAYSKLGDADEARDVVQDVFIVCYEKFEEIENMRKWLYGTLRLKILAHLKKKKSRQNINLEEVENDLLISVVNGFKDLRIILNEVIESSGVFKDDRERVLFELIAVHNFSYEKTGKQLGFTLKQVRYRYGIVVRRILDALKERGITNMEDLL